MHLRDVRETGGQVESDQGTRPVAGRDRSAGSGGQEAIPSTAEDMIYLNGVSKTFHTGSGDIRAVDDVGISIARGEFVSLVGTSGCGKSTLLKIIAGLLTADTGEVRLDGRPAAAGRRDVGIMLQSPALLPWQTVLENVLLPFVISGEGETDSTRGRAREVLHMVGLDGFVDAYPWELSGGMQQRTALARCLAPDPEIQLMDEPFGALDELTRERLNLELARIHELQHKNVIFVTHSVQEAVFLSDRVVVMTPRPGKIAGEVVVDLPRPRGSRMVSEAEFVTASLKVRHLLGLDAEADGSS